MPFKAAIASFLTRLRSKRPSPPPLPSAGPQYPLGLSQDQVDSLNRLLSTPQWRTFTEALQAVCEQEMGRILSGLPQDQYQLKCGKVQALMDVLTLPETITLKAQEINDHAQRVEPTAAGKRNLTFFGSPFWSPSAPPPVHRPVERTG